MVSELARIFDELVEVRQGVLATSEISPALDDALSSIGAAVTLAMKAELGAIDSFEPEREQENGGEGFL